MDKKWKEHLRKIAKDRQERLRRELGKKGYSDLMKSISKNGKKKK